MGNGAAASGNTSPVTKGLSSPWWNVASVGLGGIGAGIDAYMGYLALEEQKKARRQAQENFDRQMKFEEKKYGDGATARATDLVRSNYSAADQAQDWRDRLAAMRIWS